MRKTYKIVIVTAVLATFSLSLALPTFAGTAGRKNTAIVLTAATVYSAFKKNKLPAVVLGLGSAQAWKGYEDSRKRDSSRNEYARYDRYRRYDSSRDRHARYDNRNHNKHQPRGHAYGYYRNHGRG